MQMDEVLIVGEPCPCRSLLQKILSDQGYLVHVCVSGAEGLKVIVPNFDQVSVVFLFVDVSDMSAGDFVRQMKSDDRLRHLPVIAAGGEGHSEALGAALNHGAMSALSCPLDSDIITPVLRSALRERRSQDTLRENVSEYNQAIACLSSAEFVFQTVQDARNLTTLLAQSCPDPSRVMIGLVELFVNAVEHGNLNISYDEKTSLIEKGLLEAELATRLQKAEYRDKFVRVTLSRTKERVKFRVEDQGEGFDWKPYMEIDSSRVGHTHGRGIAIAKKISFDELEFFDNGATVEATIYVAS